MTIQSDIRFTLFEKLKTIGFDAIGVYPASPVSNDTADKYRFWLAQNYDGEMHYLKSNLDKRLNPLLLLDQAKSMIVLAMNYYCQKNADFLDNSTLKISKYALGVDYHKFIGEKLHQFALEFKKITTFEIKCFVDTAPIMEKYWAKQAGLGNIGKNGCLIIPDFGSWIFLAVCITDAEFDSYDVPFAKDLCGKCRKCVDACPTGALLGDGLMDARKCISYLTVEYKKEFSEQIPEWKNWIWGCDICQDVCPHNRKPVESKENQFQMVSQIMNAMNGKIEEVDFDKQYASTSVKRGGEKQLPRNIRHLQKGK